MCAQRMPDDGNCLFHALACLSTPQRAGPFLPKASMETSGSECMELADFVEARMNLGESAVLLPRGGERRRKVVEEAISVRHLPRSVQPLESFPTPDGVEFGTSVFSNIRPRMLTLSLRQGAEAAQEAEVV